MVLERRAVAVAAVAVAVSAGSALLLRPNPPEPREPVCRWLAGDVDVHTAYSAVRVRDMQLEQALSFAPGVQEQADLARERGLDFIAITDYDDVTARDDPAYGTEGLIWVPGYEHPFGGIAQFLGAEAKLPSTDNSIAAVRKVARSLRDNGGVFQIAQPGDRNWSRSYGTSIEPDAVEVWFNGPWGYDPGEIGKDGAFSMAFYDRLLDEGFDVAATGGSNSFLRGISKLAGVGQPTTWVCATEASSDGVLDAVAAGRTTVAHEYPSQSVLTEGEAGGGSSERPRESRSGGFRNPPPQDTDIPFVTIEADRSGGEAFEALLGDTIAPGDRIRVGVFDATFSVLRLVGDGSRIIDEVEVFSPTFVHSFDAPDDVTWIRAEVFARPEDTAGGACRLDPERATYCENRIGMLALSSPIYVSDQPRPTPSTSPDEQREAS